MNNKELRRANALLLEWHCRSADVSFDAFRPWVLAMLKAHVAFDGAIWGDLIQADVPRFDLPGAYVQGIDSATLTPLSAIWPQGAQNPSAPAVVSNFCLADLTSQASAQQALHHSALQAGAANCLMACSGEAAFAGNQFLILTRQQPLHRFIADDVACLEFLAPHMMQSFSLRRKQFLEAVVSPGGPATVLCAAAIVDRNGFVHDQHERFASMVRREWSDWSGRRLPQPLLELTARHAGNNWRFVGSQVSAEFLAVHDIYIVSARPRRRTDQLTERESQVAERYAAGGSFREVAQALQLAPSTVRTHLRNVFSKLQIRNKSQLSDLLR